MKIGVDLGGHTLLSARITDVDGRPAIDRIVRAETPPDRGVASVLRAMSGSIAELARDAEITGIGIAIPGMIDADRRHVRKMPNFPGWDDLDVPAALGRALDEQGLHLPVCIENDANCYALGEGSAGEAVGLSDYVVFTMGTGIGCGIVLGGHLLVGAHGMAGETGHIVVCGDAPCGCGGMGHVETLAAADGTIARARAAGLDGDFRALWERRGQETADLVLGTTLDAMARATASVCHMLDPQRIIIGGGMSQAPGIGEEIAKRAIPYLSKPFKTALDLRVSKLCNDAALYGAAALSLRAP